MLTRHIIFTDSYLQKQIHFCLSIGCFYVNLRDFSILNLKILLMRIYVLAGPAPMKCLGGPKWLGGPNFSGGTSNPDPNPGLGVEKYIISFSGFIRSYEG